MYMYMSKYDLCLLMLHVFKPMNNISETKANINKKKQACFKNFNCIDMSCEDKEGKGQLCSLDNEQL